MPSGKLCKPYKSGSQAPVTLAVSFINLKLGTRCLFSKKVEQLRIHRCVF
jgi:hypothetical protein